MFKLKPSMLKSKFIKLILEEALNTCYIIVRKKNLKSAQKRIFGNIFKSIF